MMDYQPKHRDNSVPVDTGSANGFALEYGEGTRGEINYERHASKHRLDNAPTLIDPGYDDVDLATQMGHPGGHYG